MRQQDFTKEIRVFKGDGIIFLYKTDVLAGNGVVFQPYTSVYIASRRSEMVVIDAQKYIYRKIKDEILLNPLGINISNGISVASVERAICDKLYLDGDEYFDNLRTVNFELMIKLNEIVYGNNKTIKQFIGKNVK